MNYIVYVHINKVNNKRYYGITKQNVEKRWGKNGYGYKNNEHFWRSIQKYGWDNFKHEILFENLTKEVACLLEECYILLYDTMNIEKGYNNSSGGEHNSPSKHTIDKYLRGENNPMYGKTGNLNPRSKSVMCIQTKEVFESTILASKHLGLSNEAVHSAISKGGKCGGYNWIYVDEISDEKINEILNRKDKRTIKRKVMNVQTGEIFENTTQASLSMGMHKGSVCKAISRGGKCGGYNWIYVDEIED